MCGLAALVGEQTSTNGSALIKKMCDVIKHRGPDDEGYYIVDRKWTKASYLGSDSDRRLQKQQIGNIEFANTENAIISLGHRRLSIVDTSINSHQPMVSANGNFIIVYNGEVYNYVELRRQLVSLGHQFKSDGDTEVVLAAYIEWKEKCLQKFNGMFAFLIFDLKHHLVFGARDRFGVKPLYYMETKKNAFAFASEIKQFTVLPDWNSKGNMCRLRDFLLNGDSDHSNQTFFSSVQQIMPGHYFVLDILKLDQGINEITWYNFPDKISPDLSQSFEKSSEEFRAIFEDSVRLRLRSDVPVGTGLSGGIDSSSIVCGVDALLNGDQKQYAFSAISNWEEYSEAEYIDEVVKATNVHSITTTPNIENLELELEKLVWSQDEPFATSSIFAEANVFKLVASTDVKVTLDGHGADEALAGYHSFFYVYLTQLLFSGDVKEFLKEIQRLRSTLIPSIYTQFIKNLVRQFVNPVSLLRLESNFGRLKSSYSLFHDSVLTAHDGVSRIGGMYKCFDVESLSRRQILSTSLPKQLHWCDRDSMSYSIESRAPFLDYRLVELATRTRSDFKISNGVTKRLLREALKDVIPKKIYDRTDKMGFVTAEEKWVTQEDPELFKSMLRKTIKDSEGMLIESESGQLEDMIEGHIGYDSVLWRIICWGVWAQVYRVGY